MSSLRLVEETPPRRRRKPLSVLEAANADDRLAELEAMRRRIARAIDAESTAARDLAALTRRQIELGKEISALKRQRVEEAADGDVDDEELDPSAL